MNEDVVDSLKAPLPFAVLAAQMAGFEWRDEGADDPAQFSATPPSDFVLEYTLASNVTVLIEHDTSVSGFVIRAVANVAADLDRIARIALQLSHHLPPAMRFSLEEASPPRLQVCQTLQATGLELDHLAWAITQTSEALQLAIAPEIFEDAQAQEPTTPDLSALSTVMIRG